MDSDHEGQDRLAYNDKVKNLTDDLERLRDQRAQELNEAQSELMQVSDVLSTQQTTLNHIQKAVKTIKNGFVKLTNSIEGVTHNQKSFKITMRAVDQVDKLLMKQDSEVAHEGQALLDNYKSYTVSQSKPNLELPREIIELSTNLDSMLQSLIEKYDLAQSLFSGSVTVPTEQLQPLSQPNYVTPEVGPRHWKSTGSKRHLVFSSPVHLDRDIPGGSVPPKKQKIK